MSDLALLVPIAAVTIWPIGRVANTWIKARHGYPLGGRKGELVAQSGDLPGDRRLALLAGENERLAGKVGRLEERIAVLERIATDPGARTYAEIEALRETRVADGV